MGWRHWRRRALRHGLETGATSTQQAEAILERVLYWTRGHPYLTQKVCAGIATSSDGRWSDGWIDRLVRRLFVSDEARKESNIQYVRDRVHESREREKLLRVYRRVLSGRPVADEERDPVKSQLKLTGLLEVAPDGTLSVRNRIYETVFDARWIKEAMPKVTSRRVAVVATAVAMVALALGGWLLYSGQNRDRIRAQTYTEEFLSAQSAAVRVSNLAGLFRLGDGFAADGHELFFGLDADGQLAMFADLNDPAQVGDDLQTVIRGLYTHLENDDAHDALLEAMVDDPALIEEGFPDSRILAGEIEAWLRGRVQFRNGSHQDAVTSYTQAINYNDGNPATHLDRALAHARLDQYEQALADLSRAIELDPDREDRIVDLVQSTPSLRDYLVDHRDDFPILAESVK